MTGGERERGGENGIEKVKEERVRETDFYRILHPLSFGHPTRFFIGVAGVVILVKVSTPKHTLMLDF